MILSYPPVPHKRGLLLVLYDGHNPVSSSLVSGEMHREYITLLNYMLLPNNTVLSS